MAEGRRVIKPFDMKASGVVGGESAAGPVRVHGGFLTETGGTTNLTIAVCVPVVPPGGATVPVPQAASAGVSVQVGTIIVPKGTTLPVPPADDGILFKDGAYLTFSGGAPDCLLFIS